MNSIQRIAKNTAVLITGDLATSLIGFFFMMYVARYLGVKGFGVLSFALAFTAIFNVLMDMGLSTLTIREVARDKSLTQKYLGNLGVLKIVLATATFGLISLTINLLDYPQETILVVYLIGLSVILSSFSLMFYAVFQAYERMEFTSGGHILINALRLVGALFVISQGLSITALVFTYLLASIATLVYSAITANWKFARPKIDFDFTFWKDALKQAWPFGLALIFSNVYFWIDSVMLSLMQGDEVVGWYNAAYRLVFALLFIPGAYCSSIFPVMSRFHVSSKESLRFTYEKSVKYMAIFAVPIGIGTTLLADKIITLIFGAEYTPAVAALQILIWSIVFVFISAVFAQLFNSVNKQIILTKVTGSCALLNVILNLILIPRYSYIGASIATVATELVALAAVFIWSVKIGYGVSVKKPSGVITRILMAAVIMGVFIFFSRGLALWILVPLAALLYFIALYLFKVTDREDLLLLRQVVRRQQTGDSQKK